MVYTSTQLVKCWSCSEVPEYEEFGCSAYTLYKSTELIKICRDHKHNMYPISYHGMVRCLLCRVDDINPEKLGEHLHHPLTGQEDWRRDYG
jgi:hypothetical protein